MLFLSSSHAKLLLALVSFGVHASAAAWCFEQAASRYVPVIDPNILVAISKHESGWRPDAFNINTDGSVDRCHMQINSSHLRSLRPLGIDEVSLYHPCKCAEVGAWVLADCVASFGATWEAVGCYHAGPSLKRASARIAYAKKIEAIYHRLTTTRKVTRAPLY